MSQALFRHYESLANGEKGMRKVWSHCWETAYLAQHICREKRVPRKSGEEAFLAALLHEMGRFILVDNFPDQFQAACDAARQTNSPLVPRLRESFHTSPSQITAYILELWGMPAGVIGAVAMQDDPGADQANGFSIGSALYIADGIASRQAPPDTFAPEEWNTPYLIAIGCLENLSIWEKLTLEAKPDAPPSTVSGGF